MNLFPGKFRQSEQFNTGEAYDVALNQQGEGMLSEERVEETFGAGTELENQTADFSSQGALSSVNEENTKLDEFKTDLDFQVDSGAITQSEANQKLEEFRNKEEQEDQLRGETENKDTAFDNQEALGRGLVGIDKLKSEDLLKLIFGATSPFKDRFYKLIDQWSEHKLEQGDPDDFWNKGDKFISDLYQDFKGIQFKDEVASFEAFNQNRKVEIRKMFEDLLEKSDQANVTKRASRAELKGIEAGKAKLKDGGHHPADIFDDALRAEGHVQGSAEQRSFFDSIIHFHNEPLTNAWELGLDELLDIIDRSGLFDKDSLKKKLLEIYSVSESEGYTDSIEYLTLVEHLRKIVNIDYKAKHAVMEEPVGLMQGSRFYDPIEEGSMNPGKRRIDNEIDPTTGKVANDQVVVTNQETNDVSIANARAAEQSYSADLSNPLDSHPELQDEGRRAMEDFAPGGLGVPFSLTTALNQIKGSGVKVSEIANIARLLDNKILKEFTVEFMAWDEFRQFASPAKGTKQSGYSP